MSVQARTWQVKSGSSIQAILNIAAPFDTILVNKGVYFCAPLIITKPISLIGIDKPILDGKKKDDIIWIQSPFVVISGFKIQNSNRGSMKDFAGIRIDHVHHVCIQSNQLINTFFGIYLSKSSQVLIQNNVLDGNGENDAQSGNGIHLWQSEHCVIQANHIRRHRDGIYFEFAHWCRIQKNISEHNFRYGLHFMFSDNDWYTYNIFRNNGTGVAVMYTKGIRMFMNRFENNWGDASYGMLMKDISDSYVLNNYFGNNTIGMYMEGSSRIQVAGNTYKQNGWAVKLLANCSQDTFTFNQFIGNSFDMSTNGNVYLNYLIQNYWDKYEGYDLNKDHLGDIPYRPVSLYAVLMEQIPQSVMLMRSFTIDMLDRAERIIPSLIPDKIMDVQPLMKYK